MASGYDFRTLSPLDFEDLVRDLLQADWDHGLESFGPGADQGIDLRHIAAAEQIVVQAKHYAESGFPALCQAVKAEAAKVKALAPSRYVLATSVSLTPARKAKLQAVLPGVSLASADIIGREELNALLRDHPEVEQAHFKLWLASAAVLEKMVHADVFNRTAAEIGLIKQMVPRFVQNDSVPAAENLLGARGALIVAGPPGVGKTTLARMLVWRHAQQGWKIFVADSVDDCYKVASKGEKRLILFDDFLGQVRLSTDHVRGVDARLPALLAHIAADDNLRFILTTRDYILAQARQISPRLDKGRLDAREYILNVGRYTRAVRARILYNHLHFATPDPQVRAEILADDFFLDIVDHKNFNPRIIEELTRQGYFVAGEGGIRERIETVLDNPELLWEVPYRDHIAPEGRAMMIALFINRRAATVDTLKDSYVRVSGAMGLPLHPSDIESSFRSTFRTLDGSVLGLADGSVSFANPGLRDFLQSVIVTDQLCPLLIPIIATKDELHELWAVFRASTRAGPKRDLHADAWAAALQRVIDRGGLGQFDALALAADLASAMNHTALDALVEAEIEDLEDVGFSGFDISDACALLEQSWSVSLSAKLQDRFRGSVSNAAANLLEHQAWQLNLEDIQSLQRSLSNYSDDADRVADASMAAVSALQDSIYSEADAFQSIEDLDQFECDLLAFFESVGAQTDKILNAIQSRREELEELGNVKNPSNYRNQPLFPPTSCDMSDNDLRSMFSSLGG